MRRQLDAIEPGGFDKYQAYLDCAQVNLEVSFGDNKPAIGDGVDAFVQASGGYLETTPARDGVDYRFFISASSLFRPLFSFEASFRF